MKMTKFAAMAALAGAVASTDAAALLPGAFAPNDLPRA